MLYIHQILVYLLILEKYYWQSKRNVDKSQRDVWSRQNETFGQGQRDVQCKSKIRRAARLIANGSWR